MYVSDCTCACDNAFPSKLVSHGHFKDFLFTTLSINTEKERGVREGGSLNLRKADLTRVFFVHSYCIPHLFLKWDLECQGGCK